ncbi:GPI inositol-deacylase [Cyphellophora attinorum]|uniref:GPI inositol-deacylase n=1 Tax=Cyphellophora attinorum TaxID=1664694 RepID=A0A0N1HYD3_9EURO|nr:GPI inositol-deacylase [Phialophora attinorum]KPI43387.1 GPI inositol-deacylase [Phialophora attinorum]
MLLKPTKNTHESGCSPASPTSDNLTTTDLSDVRGFQKGQHRDGRVPSVWSCRPLTLITTIIAFLSIAAIVHSFVNLQMDPQGCGMSFMTPTYIKMEGFDSEYSRFASKYGLYLYREEGVDQYDAANGDLGLRGAPVLFIPGNAGSYKQIRSLSSEGARYWKGQDRTKEEAEQGKRAFDFFTLNFNEDLSAFHGQTLIDQAEYVNEAIAYILSLYHHPVRGRKGGKHLPDPNAVILVGHSMGGIVARTVLVTSKYQANSVNTIITMSTPHARPPVAFDADMVSLYDKINNYWRASYLQDEDGMNPLAQTTLISIAGGGRDTTVPSDYTSVSSLLPESHGFTVFTSGIPGVWTSMDHLAITWADEMRKSIIKCMYDISDVRKPGQTIPREERMRVFRNHFLTGLESNTPKHLLDAGRTHDVLLKLGRSTNEKDASIAIRQLGAQDQPSTQLLQVPAVTHHGQRILSVLTNHIPIAFWQLELAIYSDRSVEWGSAATRLACKRPTGDGIQLPASTRTSQNAFDRHIPFTYLRYDAADLRDFQFVAIVDKATEISNNWIFAEFATIESATTKSTGNLAKLLLGGEGFELPPARPMVNEITIPALHSSLLAYKLKVRQHGCGDEAEMFTPLVRQYIEQPHHESKYFVNFKEGDINLHGVAPFMPPLLDGSTPGAEGVTFQIFSDSTCNSALEVHLHADLPGSFGKLVMRYRTIFAVFPLLVVAMVLRKQFRVYDNTGIFIGFSDALEQSLRLPLPVLLLSMIFFATAFSTAGSISSPAQDNATMVDFNKNDLLLGSQDSFFWFLVPLAGLICVGACVGVHFLVLGILHLFVGASRVYAQVTTSQSRPGPSPPSSSDEKDGNHKEKRPLHTTLPPLQILSASSPRRRLINTVLLLLLVATVIPYPFAYVVACLVQLATTTRALSQLYTSRPISVHASNFFNYTYAVLILMLWVLPLNLPVLIVWVHNLAVPYLSAFGSHHNILAIAPFIVLVETLAGGKMVPRLRIAKKGKKGSAGTGYGRLVTNVGFFALAVYAAVYGMTYAYRLHWIACVVAGWLGVLHWLGGSINIGGRPPPGGKVVNR